MIVLVLNRKPKHANLFHHRVQMRRNHHLKYKHLRGGSTHMNTLQDDDHFIHLLKNNEKE